MEPANTLPTPQNSLPEAGVKPDVTPQASNGARSTQATSSPPASNPPATTLNETANSQPADDVATSSPQATPAPTQPTMRPEIPEGIQPTPIAAIDLFIRRGYVSRDTLGEIMKHNFKGKTFRREIVQRLALFEARQPPFDSVPATSQISSGVNPAGIPQQVSGASPENTRVLAPAPVPSSMISAGNLPQATGSVPASNGTYPANASK